MGAVAVAWVGVALGGSSLISGIMGSRSAADAAKANKRAENRMTREQLKRQTKDQAIDLSMVETLQAASGFSAASVTSQIYKKEFRKRQLEEVEWLKSVGASRFNQWQARESAYKAQGIGQALGTAANIAFNISDMLRTPVTPVTPTALPSPYTAGGTRG